MKKNTKKILVFSVLGMFMLMFAMSAVSAWTISIGSDGEQKEGGVHDPIDNPEWLLGTVEFFNVGESWADIIVAIAVILIIFAAAFDIMEFTAFESPWDKYLISAGIALIFAVVGAVGIVAEGIAYLVGGSVVLATLVALILGAVLFVAGGWAKGRMKVFKAKQGAMKAKAGYIKAANAIGGLKDIDKAAARDKR